MLIYKRILLKLSGESLMGTGHSSIDPLELDKYVKNITEAIQMGAQIAIVIGGGNIFRGLKGADQGFDRVKGDQMGMLATVINSLALQSAFEANGAKARVFTSVKMEPVGEVFSKSKVLESFQGGEVAILAGGTGNPYFTTDTAAALRALEIEADVLLKGTRVDGIYDRDPEKFPEAKKFENLSFDEAYQRNLKIMDLTAFTMCLENNLPIVVFDFNTPGNLKKLLLGEKIGTLVKK